MYSVVLTMLLTELGNSADLTIVNTKHYLLTEKQSWAPTVKISTTVDIDNKQLISDIRHPIYSTIRTMNIERLSTQITDNVDRKVPCRKIAVSAQIC